MKKLISSFVLMTATACLAETVEVREEVMHVRPGQDRWLPRSGSVGTYAADGLHLTTAPGKRGLWLTYDTTIPRAPRLPYAKKYIVKTSCTDKGGYVTIGLKREEGRINKGKPFTFKAPLADETVFDTSSLNPADHYYLDTMAFNLKTTNSVVTLKGIDAVTDESAEDALRIDVISTGNAFRAVRYALGEKAVLVFRNPTADTRTWRGELAARDFFGREVKVPYDVTIPAGGEVRQELPPMPAKGLWKMSDTLRFAVLDAHVVTPLQPEDEFRLGVNYHVERYADVDRAITMDAAVAIGAKLIRGNYSPRKTETGWDFSRLDAITRELNDHGLAVDAIFGGGREFGEAAARAFGKRIAWYEFGNERDMSNPERFPYTNEVATFKAFSSGIKSVCPDAKVIYGGFAAESSFKHPPRAIRRNFQEDLMTECRDFYDAHAVHLHSPFKEYVGKLDNFMAWRKDRGIIDKPWYANETAVSSVRAGEDGAAVTVWLKVLYAASRGSVDYIWYNLRGTGYCPTDPEQGYGLMTGDYRPRYSFASFSALAKVLYRLQANGVLHDGKNRQVMRFKGTRGGKGCCVVAGWDFIADERGCAIRIGTDAGKAVQVDLMGNKTTVPLRGGIATWTIGKLPSAIVLVDASKADPLAADLKAEAKEPVKRIEPGRPGKPGGRPADLVLRDFDQVYEIYEAKPEYVHRTWRWYGDLAAEVRFFLLDDDQVVIDVLVEDDIHTPLPDKPLEGDACEMRIGDKTVTLVAKDGDRSAVQVNAHDKRMRTHYRHTITLPKGSKVPFNIRIYDNDGEGPDGWIEYRPFDEPAKVEIVR